MRHRCLSLFGSEAGIGLVCRSSCVFGRRLQGGVPGFPPRLVFPHIAPRDEGYLCSPVAGAGSPSLIVPFVRLFPFPFVSRLFAAHLFSPRVPRPGVFSVCSFLPTLTAPPPHLSGLVRRPLDVDEANPSGTWKGPEKGFSGGGRTGRLRTRKYRIGVMVFPPLCGASDPRTVLCVLLPLAPVGTPPRTRNAIQPSNAKTERGANTTNTDLGQALLLVGPEAQDVEVVVRCHWGVEGG